MHGVRIGASSRLGSLLDRAELKVNSFHHQAVKALGTGFVATGWAEDDIVEAIEAPGNRFAIGVQWHPEAMTRTDLTSRRLFEVFVAAAAKPK